MGHNLFFQAYYLKETKKSQKILKLHWRIDLKLRS